MKRTPNQDKALGWYLEKHNLMPQLSTHPVYYFVDKDGNKSQDNIHNILGAWEKMRKQEKKNDFSGQAH